ncbi:hypothetical protein [Fodinicola feengrottensis]|uniref:hypothetical protein n=1 Tax=Fodinicola feengrottensis TaxID=435914 RepID=UPI0013D6ED02|nr:hypothetical protein [Fodinicola feengrottensis]
MARLRWWLPVSVLAVVVMAVAGYLYWPVPDQPEMKTKFIAAPQDQLGPVLNRARFRRRRLGADPARGPDPGHRPYGPGALTS